MIHVLFVCLGNICRSPIAEGVFKQLIRLHNLESHVSCDSCGTASYHIGELPDERARSMCRHKGIELIHRARAIAQKDFVLYDFILVMDQSNFNHVLRMSPEGVSGKINLLRSFADDQANEVPDPYYGDEKDFESVFEIVYNSCDAFIKKEILPRI